MKILVSPATEDQLNDDITGLFVDLNSRLFNYSVEYHVNDYARITDSVGRIMPVDYTELRDFARLFTALADHQDAYTMYTNTTAEIMSALTAEISEVASEKAHFDCINNMALFEQLTAVD